MAPRRSFRCATLLLPAALLGCGDKGEGSDPHGTSNALTPADGPWLTGEASVLEDGCDMVLEGATLALTNVGERTFLLYEEGGHIDTACTLAATAGSFTCSDQAEETNFSETTGQDALVSALWSTSGEFTTTVEGSLEMATVVTCAGTDCDLLEELGALPCVTRFSVEIAHDG